MIRNENAEDPIWYWCPICITIYIKLKLVLPMLCTSGSHHYTLEEQWWFDTWICWFWVVFLNEDCSVLSNDYFFFPAVCSQASNWEVLFLWTRVVQVRTELQVFCSNTGNLVFLMRIVAVTNYNTESLPVRKEHSPDDPKYLFSFLAWIFHYAFVESSLTKKSITNNWSMGDFWNLVLAEGTFCSTGSFSYSC